jgi:hypothetical protein
MFSGSYREKPEIFPADGPQGICPYPDNGMQDPDFISFV